LRPWRNAATKSETLSAELLMFMKPTSGTSCARAANGHAAAPLSSDMNWRRLMPKGGSPQVSAHQIRTDDSTAAGSLLHCRILIRLRSALGHEPKSLSWPLCQLPPATADMTLHRPSPLCAITRREQVQQDAPENAHPTYSMTSSAMASSVGGTSRPSALAVLILINSSSFVACCTGRSAGFSPFRMRPV